MKAAHYRTRVIDSIAHCPAADWDRLVPDRPGALFVAHAWLAALEATGCVGGPTGWAPRHLLLLDREGRLVGAAPRYLKSHSYGEYVFDWAWAEAYERHGLAYYPKWLCAVPFTPVQGPRLLAVDSRAADALADALLSQARGSRHSSLHILFPTDEDDGRFAADQLLRRTGVQFQWRNAGYAGFDDFLSALAQPKRKKIRAERRRVAEQGVSCRRFVGAEIGESQWDFFHACYRNTYAEHQSTPYLNRAFFHELGTRMPQACVMIVASRDDRPIAASLILRDRTRLYGRYWGALERVPCLHFEVAYYQAIEAAIALGIEAIEGGAQGEHKLARGFLPVETCSRHWLAHPQFADAVERYLAREGAAMGAYLDELGERSPFRTPA